MIISEAKVREIITAGTPARLYEGKRVLVLTPDGTRTCPLPMMVRILNEAIGGRAAKLDFMVALGTHPILPEEKILELYGITPAARRETFGQSSFFSHRWDLPETFRRIGELSEEEVAAISGGLLRERVPIDINQKIFDYDLILILGPVFPHEVVGMSGGAKYLFPGISGGEFLHFFHWLGALITCRKIIGIKDTPVRQVIHRALEKLALPVHCLAMVVDGEAQLSGLFTGDVREAWSAAADLSQKIHVVVKKRPYPIVLGRAPEMYDEIWTAGKVVYKLEQVVAPGGKLIVYAPPYPAFLRYLGGRDRKRSATTSGTISLPGGMNLPTSPGVSWPIRPTSAEPGSARAASSGPISTSSWPRPSPGRRA